ncbi:MAG: hypothetical protein GY803_07870 [Chloroflexi bacterium]|nr:hypothetical protein [Chloroflexota bacterium]
MTTLFLDSQDAALNAPIHFNLHVAVTLHISADDARRLVNRDIVTELGTGLGAQNPELAIRGQQIIWVVPIVLSLPHLGELGQVGTIEVDAQTGDILNGETEPKRILQHAQRLYTGATLSAE